MLENGMLQSVLHSGRACAGARSRQTLGETVRELGFGLFPSSKVIS